MKYFSFLVYTLMFITITVPVAIVIFDFFDIQFEVYGSYLFWFISLALFNAILPYQVKNIYEDDLTKAVSIYKDLTPSVASDTSDSPTLPKSEPIASNAGFTSIPKNSAGEVDFSKLLSVGNSLDKSPSSPALSPALSPASSSSSKSSASKAPAKTPKKETHWGKSIHDFFWFPGASWIFG
jgi:hypothetical protein